MAAMFVGLAAVAALSIHQLGRFPYFPHGIDWPAAITGISPLLPETGWAALKVWAFWGWGAAVIAGVLLTIDPALGPGDAILAGAAGLWVSAYLLGIVLGPIGLFRAPVLWALVGAGTLWLWRKRPSIAPHPPSPGQKLTLLALAILMLLMMPVQLGSPVVPFPDALSWPAAAQRILTFHVYTPFDDDPYGLWGPFAQAPGWVLFCAMLALGSHTPLAVVTQSAAMVPFAALVILALYRLGRALFDDTVGGIAALLLFVTAFPRTLQSVRPTATVFALTGLGLAFFLDSRRNRTRMAIGAAFLGTSVTVHVFNGALTMAVAAGGAALWLAAGDRSRLRAGAVCLAGALLLGAPEFPIALAEPLPYPILLLGVLVGLTLIRRGASMLSLEPPRVTRLSAALDIVPVAILALALLLQGWIGFSFPLILTIAGLAGLIVLSWKSRTSPDATHYAGLAAVAMLFGPAQRALQLVAARYALVPVARLMLLEVGKLENYWCPYFLTLFAAISFAVVYRRWSKAVGLFAVLTVLTYPWHVLDPNQFDWSWHYHAHSLVENLAFNLDIAANGYWGGGTDRRWSVVPGGLGLLEVLNREIRAGRITAATRVVHLTNDSLWWGFMQYAAFTGINDDPFEVFYDPTNPWHAHSRVRPARELPAAMAARPRYVMIDVPLKLGQALQGYDEIFHQGRLSLFRRRELGP